MQLRSLVAPVECSSTWGGMSTVMKGTMPLPTLTSLDTGWTLSLCCKGCALLSFHSCQMQASMELSWLWLQTCSASSLTHSFVCSSTTYVNCQHCTPQILRPPHKGVVNALSGFNFMVNKGCVLGQNPNNPLQCNAGRQSHYL